MLFLKLITEASCIHFQGILKKIEDILNYYRATNAGLQIQDSTGSATTGSLMDLKSWAWGWKERETPAFGRGQGTTTCACIPETEKRACLSGETGDPGVSPEHPVTMGRPLEAGAPLI